MTEREFLAEQWRAVATALGVQHVAPYELTVLDGTHWTFAVLLPQFGGEHGMLIDVEYPTHVASAAVAAGYGASSMQAEHHHIPIDPQNYVECLEDWGWVGPGDVPNWYLEAKRP
jgi:hypothetical protein